MTDNAAVLAEVCTALSSNRLDHASAVLHERYRFEPVANTGRRMTLPRMLALFVRDGFIDRYSGQRLVCPAALRLISLRLPEAFPYHPNWRMDVCHIAYWELSATVDHIAPVARGGADHPENWVTTSMLRNSAKSNFTLDELGWKLQPQGDMNVWDGLLGWFLNEARTDPSIRTDRYFRVWLAAAGRR